MNLTDYKSFRIKLIIIVTIITSLTCCTYVDVITPEVQVQSQNIAQPIDSISIEVPLDNGSVGVAIDSRSIFKKGYTPAKAKISFPKLNKFDTIMDINYNTNIAVFKVSNDNLSETEKEMIENGIDINVKIFDESGLELSNYDNSNFFLDDTNFPLNMKTEKETILQPLTITEGEQYLLQIENSKGGILTSSCSACFIIENYNFENDNSNQQFFFTPVKGKKDVFLIDHNAGYAEGTSLYFETGPEFFNLGNGVVDLPNDEPQEFLIEQDIDGWIIIKLNNIANGYLYVDEDGTALRIGTQDKADRFRLISDNINWTLDDLGAEFIESTLPPTQLDFAYSAVLINCSSAILTEQVGRNKSRTQKSTYRITESLQLFSSHKISAGFKIGGEVTGGFIDGNYEYTTSSTTSTENTWEETTTVEEETSRIRTIEIPPFTKIEIYDAVKTIPNVVKPFVQKLRLSATYSKSGEVLSGPEILTQMKFNFANGVITKINDAYVEFTLRGRVKISELMEVTTIVNELSSNCDN